MIYTAQVFGELVPKDHRGALKARRSLHLFTAGPLG